MKPETVYLLAICGALAACGGPSFPPTPRATDPGLWLIDLATGDRSGVVLFDRQRPAKAMALDAAAGHAYVVTTIELVRVDVATGAMDIVSDPSTGAGPPPTQLEAVAIDAANDRAFVYDAGTDAAVIEVDLATGDRRVVSDAVTGAGPAFNIGRAAMAYDPDADGLLVATSALPQGAGFDDALVTVSVATGDRAVLSSSTVGAGPAFSFAGVFDLAADFDTGLAYVHFGSKLVEVDLATGDRTLVHDSPPHSFHIAIAVDPRDGRVFEFQLSTLLSIDAATHEATTVSGESTGTGPRLGEPRGLAVDTTGNRVLLAAHVIE